MHRAMFPRLTVTMAASYDTHAAFAGTMEKNDLVVPTWECSVLSLDLKMSRDYVDTRKD